MRAALLACLLLVLGTQAKAAPEPGVVHFTAVGDISGNGNAQAVLDKIGALDSDLTLALGDLSYGTTGQEQAWCDLVTARVGSGYPFELISGNHESNGQNGNINDFSACLPNQLPGLVGTYGRQYYVDVPQEQPLVRFIAISPALTFPGPEGTWSYAAGTPRYNWTKDKIDAAQAANIPWIVVGMHKPCITVGNYSCDPGADLFNLLLSEKVDLVLSGHEHTYQRSHQLGLKTGCTNPTWQADTFDADCITDSNATDGFTKGAGTVIGVVGTGGVSLYDVDTADPEIGYLGKTGGMNTNRDYGVLDVSATETSLSANFARAAAPGGTQTLADTFTITKQATPPNQPPVASYAENCTNLSCTFDGTGSTDPDGSIATHTWSFGDNGTATGGTTNHTYANPGTYPVTLTVVDDDGAQASTTKSVTVTNPGVVVFAEDDFDRTVSPGFGSTAPKPGGNYTYGGSTSLFSVSSGRGNIQTNAGSGPTALLTGVSAPATNLTTTLSLDKVPAGSSFYASVFGRRIANEGYYAKVRISNTGAMYLELLRRTSTGAEVSLQAPVLVPGTYATGDTVNVRLQVLNRNPTTIQAKLWKTGTTEPASWQRTITDSTASLQANGAIAISSYLSSSVTNGPVTLRIDNLLVTAP